MCVGLAEHDGADRVLVEVEGEADGAVGELEQLVDGAVRQARDAGDAVADLGDAADGAGLERGLEALEVLLERCRDVGSGERELSHGVDVSLEPGLEVVETGADAAVDDGVADGGDESAEHGGVDDDLEVDLLAGGVGQCGGEAGLLVVGEGDGRADLGDLEALRAGGPLDERGR